MATEPVRAGRGSWPEPLGSVRHDRCAAAPIGPLERVRWTVELPRPGVDAISVDADGRVYVSTADALHAVREGSIEWTVPTVSFGGCLVLEDGLLVVSDPAGLAIRRQRDGGLVHLIPAPRRTLPTVVAGRLVYVQTGAGSGREVRAVDLAGTVAWTRRLERAASYSYPPLGLGSRIAVADGEALRVLDAEGGQAWEHRGLAGPGWTGPLIGLPDGRLLGQYESSADAATLIVDPVGSTADRVPAHLPIGRPMASAAGRLALPGWEVEDASRQPEPALYVVSLPNGRLARRLPLHAPVVSVAAGADGAIAYAASPSLERWTAYRRFPGFEDSMRCAVGVIRKDGVEDTTVAAPITGPIAVGAGGELLVPVAGTLVCLSA